MTTDDIEWYIKAWNILDEIAKEKEEAQKGGL